MSRANRSTSWRDLVLMFGSFVGATLLAELLGADNTGIALGVGQIAFLIATTYVIVRPRPSGRRRTSQ